VDMEGDCAHCWSDGVDGVAGTLQNCPRKQACRVTLDCSHQTPMIGNLGCAPSAAVVAVIVEPVSLGATRTTGVSGSHASLQI
jgi:hypothetical protein